MQSEASVLSLDDSLDELGELARSAGAQVIAVFGQRLRKRANTYLGRGKLEEVAQAARDRRADVVILDDELTPAQQRVVEDTTRVKVIDRTALIIDIFAKRAQTREGRLQVELAQHEYLLPRLAGQWSHLERLGGGIGTRGPGETQIETDRRLVRGRIARLKREIEAVRNRRSLYRERRKKQGIPIVSMVGYTNAGKSTLFNQIGRADVRVRDQLFATLDPVTRRARLPSGSPFLVSDTVGFINKLPTTLVAAFRATLEEIAEADVLVHVVDMTHPNAAGQVDVVTRTLEELGLADRPTVLVLNKADLALPEARSEAELYEAAVSLFDGAGPPEEGVVLASALHGWGIGRLLAAVEERVDDEPLPDGVYEIG